MFETGDTRPADAMRELDQAVDHQARTNAALRLGRISMEAAELVAIARSVPTAGLNVEQLKELQRLALEAWHALPIGEEERVRAAVRSAAP